MDHAYGYPCTRRKRQFPREQQSPKTYLLIPKTFPSGTFLYPLALRCIKMQLNLRQVWLQVLADMVVRQGVCVMKCASSKPVVSYGYAYGYA